MRTLILLGLAASVVACSTAPPVPEQRSARAQERLTKELAGRTPGQAVSCLPTYRSNDMIAIDDSTLLFRDGTTRIWRNDVQGGGCNLLGAGGYTLVTKTSGGIGLCRGDIGQVMDLRSGTTVGSCVMGDFTPYTRP